MIAVSSPALIIPLTDFKIEIRSFEKQNYELEEISIEFNAYFFSRHWPRSWGRRIPARWAAARKIQTFPSRIHLGPGWTADARRSARLCVVSLLILRRARMWHHTHTQPVRRLKVICRPYLISIGMAERAILIYMIYICFYIYTPPWIKHVGMYIFRTWIYYVRVFVHMCDWARLREAGDRLEIKYQTATGFRRRNHQPRCVKNGSIMW